MRTQEEIIAKISEVKDNDWMGTIRCDLIDFLDYPNAKEFLKDEVKEDDWVTSPSTIDTVKEKMREYLSFAFEKAENERGLSAGRSMDHYYAWIWLIDEEARFGDVRDYGNYGIPHLNDLKDFLAK